MFPYTLHQGFINTLYIYILFPQLPAKPARRITGAQLQEQLQPAAQQLHHRQLQHQLAGRQLQDRGADQAVQLYKVHTGLK